MTVLVIDDDIGMRDALRWCLEEEGIDVAVAGDAYDGVRELSEHDFDAVVTDLDMPGDGKHVLERAQVLRPGTPVIIMTGKDAAAVSKEPVSRRAYAVLEKPFAPDRLVTLLRKARGRRGKRRPRD